MIKLRQETYHFIYIFNYKNLSLLIVNHIKLFWIKVIRGKCFE